MRFRVKDLWNKPNGLALLAIVCSALTLRMPVTSVGALLEEIVTGLRASSLFAGILTSAPVICFAGLRGIDSCSHFPSDAKPYCRSRLGYHGDGVPRESPCRLPRYFSRFQSSSRSQVQVRRRAAPSVVVHYSTGSINATTGILSRGTRSGRIPCCWASCSRCPGCCHWLTAGVLASLCGHWFPRWLLLSGNLASPESEDSSRWL